MEERDKTARDRQKAINRMAIVSIKLTNQKA